MSENERTLDSASQSQQPQEWDVPLLQQQALITIGKMALEYADPDQLIRESIDMIAGVLGTDCCEMLVLDAEQGLTLKAARVCTAEEERAHPNPEVMAQARLSVETDTEIIVEDFARDARFQGAGLGSSLVFTSGLAVPVPGKKTVYGVLGVHTHRPHHFSTQDVNFLKKIANLFALAIDRQEVEFAQRITQEELSYIREGVEEGITIQARSGELVYANHTAAKLIGFTKPEDMITTPIEEIRHTFRMLDEEGKIFPREQLPAYRIFRGEMEEGSCVVLYQILATGDHGWWKIRSSRLNDYSRPGEYVINFFQDVTDLKDAERDQYFLAQVGDVLASALDYQEMLKKISQLAVQNLSDWCTVHQLTEEGEVYRLEMAHKDPQKLAALDALIDQAPSDSLKKSGFLDLVQSERELYCPAVETEDLTAMGGTEESSRILCALGIHSVLVLPLIARGHSLGTISLLWDKAREPSEEARHLKLAKELARRTAVAMDNLRLYQETRTLNAELEVKVARRTAELERLVDNLHGEIIERQKIEKNLERSRALFSDLFNLSPDAIFLVNSKGAIVRFNEQGRSLFGYEEEELLGKPIDLLLPPRFQARALRFRENFQKSPVRGVMAGGRDLYGRHKQGREFPVDVTLSPVEIQDEWQIIAVVRDITQQKRIQAELAEVQHRLMDNQEGDRLMIAQELHDGSIQELFSLTFQLAEMESDLVESGAVEMGEKMNAISQNIQKVIHGLRNLSRDLRPPALAPFGLEQAIYSHIERFQEIHPDLIIHTNLTPDGQLLEERLRLVLYRIYQNAVSNVARHAEARQLWVRLDFNEEELILDIKDDGKGFEVPERWVEWARAGHLGLVGTQERVEAIGGKLKVISKPGKGTLVRVTVPLVPEGLEEAAAPD